MTDGTINKIKKDGQMVEKIEIPENKQVRKTSINYNFKAANAIHKKDRHLIFGLTVIWNQTDKKTMVLYVSQGNLFCREFDDFHNEFELVLDDKPIKKKRSKT